MTGIGGLSVAYTLAKAGHKVRVLDKNSGVGIPAAGLRVPPNMSKILKRWVGEEELRKTAVRILASPWCDRKSVPRIQRRRDRDIAPWKLYHDRRSLSNFFLIFFHYSPHR
jgi:2-polyprenyl-6-methoxyphenol hydroxylase-like FAD-dependent oxidoreductase